VIIEKYCNFHQQTTVISYHYMYLTYCTFNSHTAWCNRDEHWLARQNISFSTLKHLTLSSEPTLSIILKIAGQKT